MPGEQGGEVVTPDDLAAPSTITQRSASPSKQTPRSAFWVLTASWSCTRLEATSGLGSWAKLPLVFSKFSSMIVRPSAMFPAADFPKILIIVPAMPLLWASDDDLERADLSVLAGKIEERTHVPGVGGPEIPRVPYFPWAETIVALSTIAACLRISARPVVSPTGLCGALLTLKPLYCGGLWLAVTITPPAVEVVDGEDHRRIDEPQVDHVAPVVVDALHQGLHQHRARRTHVASDEDVLHHRGDFTRGVRIAQQVLARAVPDLPCERFVERIGVYTADVVRLEDPSEHRVVSPGKAGRVGDATEKATNYPDSGGIQSVSSSTISDL